MCDCRHFTQIEFLPVLYKKLRDNIYNHMNMHVQLANTQKEQHRNSCCYHLKQHTLRSAMLLRIKAITEKTSLFNNVQNRCSLIDIVLILWLLLFVHDNPTVRGDVMTHTLHLRDSIRQSQYQGLAKNGTNTFLVGSDRNNNTNKILHHAANPSRNILNLPSPHTSTFDIFLPLPKFKKLTLSKSDVAISTGKRVVGYNGTGRKNKLQAIGSTKEHSNNQLNKVVNLHKVTAAVNQGGSLETAANHFERNLFKTPQHEPSLEDLFVDYVTNIFEKLQHLSKPELLFALSNLSLNDTNKTETIANNSSRVVRQIKVGTNNITIELPRTLATGRLLFLTGLKKVLWPLFMGLQILKSLLIAMFIPAIISSFGKLFSKGISSGSAPLFIRPMDAPTDLDFRDNAINFEDDNKFLIHDATSINQMNDPYGYHQAEASQVHGQYVPHSALTRFGMNERQQQFMQDSYLSVLQSLGSASFKNSGSLATSSSSLFSPLRSKPFSNTAAANVNTFQTFHKVPDSSLLLSNYDPFYSPLLSRLDSVFAQLKLNSSDENCREKVICLMYANPTKYAPYSNLVSAQLSRELNELRKPTSDNPDILRFFKYMRAAKDGQDGVDCEHIYDSCPEFKDFENPAMVSTYNDINKLVQARQMV